jgi:hypothetical protein
VRESRTREVQWFLLNPSAILSFPGLTLTLTLEV